MTTPTTASDGSLTPIALGALAERFADRLSTHLSVRDHHGRDESRFPAMPPQAVLFAQSNEDVVDAVRLCRRYRVPIVPYGVGSSVEGQVLAVRGGLTIDMSRMNRVLAIQAEDLTATVQAGVTHKQLNEALEGSGLFFPIDPGADASLGGMAATRASGTNAVRYGTMRENVLGLTVVDADGDLIRPPNRARKSAAGYDLTRLFIGSEGTLGVITEVTVRLMPLPEAVSAAVCCFDALEDAVDTVIETIQLGVPVARCEYLCPATIHALNSYDHSSLREAHSLFFEFHGSETGVREQARVVEQLAGAHRGRGFEWALRTEERNRLWNARHHALYAVLTANPGTRPVLTDACVPISRLAECMSAVQRMLDTTPLPSVIAGHVGDGNFHCGIFVDPDDAGQIDAAERLNEEIVRLAVSMDGTCTGEHGIGLHKIGFLRQEAGDKAVELMRRIKRALDPDDLFNPGKILG
ncbi:MAG: FAD-linked oxidase C-terminal domain-containing protein [Burkholderiaceae bacterium]